MQDHYGHRVSIDGLRTHVTTGADSLIGNLMLSPCSNTLLHQHVLHHIFKQKLDRHQLIRHKIVKIVIVSSYLREIQRQILELVDFRFIIHCLCLS